MTSTLADLTRLGILSRLDAHLATVLGRLVPGTAPEVLLGAALASRAVRAGHVCADLEWLHASPPTGDAGEPAVLPSLSGWRAALSASRLVGTGDPEGPTPLVFRGEKRLYLYRYFRYEERLGRALRQRAETVPVDELRLREALDRTFEPRDGAADLPRVAAAMTACRNLAVISGGPGTGKTYTVTQVLALLQELARASGSGDLLRIRLLAPTGKAAQRLGESIKSNVERHLRCDDAIKQSIPLEASTIHRALGYQPRTPTRFRHGADNPLPADVVLVDEASMVDVALMAKLVDAVPRHARLILLGDKDQLASVEAGAILGDIYGDGAVGYSPALAGQLERVLGRPVPHRDGTRPSSVQDSRVHLTLSHRFRPDGGIARLSQAVNSSDPDEALRVLRSDPDVGLLDTPDRGRLEDFLGSAAAEAFAELTGAEPLERFDVLRKFRILCAHRKGKLGVEAVNALVEARLREERVLVDRGEWYDGRPIIVTENDYQLDLFNGDVGIICARGGQGVGAVFIGTDGRTLRTFPPASLPAHETVFAMTVHKSQGSEFDHVALVLPEKDSPILTRELVYTGITRASKRVNVLGSEAILRAAIARPVQRASGLREMLAG